MPGARTLFGFALAFLLAFAVDFVARALNLLSGYPWGVSMHQNIQFVGIVLGAALGGYLVWLVPSRSRILAAGTLLIVLAAAFLGAVLGRIVGPGVEQGFWWSKSSTDSTVHLVAAALGTLVATVVALVIRRSSQSGPEVPGRPLRWEERET